MGIFVVMAVANEVAWRSLGALIPYARNPRTHTDAQVAQMVGLRLPSITHPLQARYMEAFHNLEKLNKISASVID